MPEFKASEETLDKIAMLETPPAEAYDYLKRVLALPGAEPNVYDTCAAVTWKLLTTRVYGDDAQEWYGISRQISGLMEDKDFHLSQKILAFSDLILQSARFGAANSIPDLASREHVRKIIAIVGDICHKNKNAKRTEILKRSELKQSNLSRLLTNMESAGLINRKIAGKEVLVTLTDAGKLILRPGGSDDGWESSVFDIEPRIPMKPLLTVV